MIAHLVEARAAKLTQEETKADREIREAREKDEAQAQLLLPSKAVSNEILISHFVVNTKVATKPTFNQKKELSRLRNLSMKRFVAEDYHEGWIKTMTLLDGTFSDININGAIDIDITTNTTIITTNNNNNNNNNANANTNLTHPLYWKAIGFSGEHPMMDFNKYQEPEDGLGEVTNETDFKHGFKVQNNVYKELPLSPLTSRYRGGLLTQQCIIHFIETFPYSKVIIRNRRRHLKTTEEEPNYPWVVIAMEMTRFLALYFMLIKTRVQDPPNFPIQPDMRVMVPFDIDWQDKSPLIIYPYSRSWTFLSEKNAFKRIHSLCLIVYDCVYKSKNNPPANLGDTYTILDEVTVFMRDCLDNCETVAELENIINGTFLATYSKEHRVKVSTSIAKGTVDNVIEHALQTKTQTIVETRKESQVLEERGRLCRREQLRMEENDWESRELSRSPVKYKNDSKSESDYETKK